MNQIEDDEGYAPSGEDLYTIVTAADGGTAHADREELDARAKDLGFAGSQAKPWAKHVVSRRENYMNTSSTGHLRGLGGRPEKVDPADREAL